MLTALSKTAVQTLPARDVPYEIRDGKMPGLLIRVQPTSRKTWYVEFRLPNGKRNRVRIGAHPIVTPEMARDQAHRILAAVVEGRDPSVEKKESRELVKREREAGTLRAFVENRYAPWALTHRKTGAGTVARLKTVFADLLDRKLADISPWLIDKHRQERRKAGLKAATVNRDVVALRAALAKAVEWSLIEAHPLAAVKPIKVDTTGKVRFLTDEEDRRLEMALKDAPGYLRTLVVLARNTGCRRGELFGLLWGDIDVVNRILTVRAEGAKSGRARHVPLNASTIDALRAWKHAQFKDAEPPSHALVFPGRNGTRLNNVSNSWRSLLRAAKIEHCRWHDLRHDFASRLVMAGVDLRTVQELLGHSTPVMTMRYAHLSPEHKAAAVAALVRPAARLKAV